MPRLGMINVHASLLPRYRGAAPVHRAVIAGERETGVTIMRVVKALDAGPMLATVAQADRTRRDQRRGGTRSRARWARRCSSTSSTTSPRAGRLKPRRTTSLATYAPRLTKEDGRDRLDRTGERIHNLVRGLHPWPHAFTFHDGARLIILSIERSVGAGGDARAEAPGTIVAAEGDDLVVADRRGRCCASSRCRPKASGLCGVANFWPVIA